MDEQINYRLSTLKILLLLVAIYVMTGVCGNSTAVCGWTELYNASIVKASFVMFDSAFMGWSIVILFVVYQFMVFIKTRTLTASWAVGALFISMYYGALKLSSSGYAFMKPIAGQILLVILVFELAGIVYYWLFK